VREHSRTYHPLERVAVAFDAAMKAGSAAMRYRKSEPDQARLTPAPLDRQIDLGAELLQRFGIAGNARRQRHVEMPGVTAAPRWDEIASALGMVASAEELAAVDAEAAMVDGRRAAGYTQR
jgi:hypothetical protein